jgi:hypothetical protein
MGETVPIVVAVVMLVEQSDVFTNGIGQLAALRPCIFRIMSYVSGFSYGLNHASSLHRRPVRITSHGSSLSATVRSDNKRKEDNGAKANAEIL